MASSSGKANKKGNVIHRTTSESLRLGDDLYKIPQNSGNRKKAISSPSCSFQITGVLTRCDLEDESADDLDESHTDDISRVTDNETPSFSEDSRDTDDHHITQTVISSISSQQSISVSKINDANDIHVSPIELDKSSNNTNNTNNTVGRFTVVKSENVVPFSRGRWTCFDYVDEIAKISVGLDKIFGHEPNNTKTGTSINYLEVGSIIDEKTRPYWESNCQQPYLYTGSILMPQPIPIYVPVSSRTSNQKNKKTNSIALSQNILIKPSSHVVDNFASNALSFHMLVNGNKKNQHTFDIMDNLQNRAMETETLTSGALELATESITCENNNSEASSVACTATIDTKIEHALDVVKNHLTHAVRLEVEELKVKINELVERISNLEYENDLLRANVPPEVLATLNNTSAE